MEVSTAIYMVCHGRNPRGTGNWAFVFHLDGRRVLGWAPGEMSYTNAKRWAIDYAKQNGYERVSVAT